MKNNIKQLREEKGYTQKECADKFSVTLRAWQTYEQGVSEPKQELLCKIADMFNVSLDYLLGRTTVREMNVLGKHEYTEEEVRSIDQELLDNYTALPVELRRSFIKMLEEMFDITFEVEEEDFESEYGYEDGISQGAAG